MGGLMRYGELGEQFGQISETTIEEKIPFLQMLQCIEHPYTTTEPNQFLQSLLQIQTLESNSCLTLETTIKRDPGQTDDPEKDPRTENEAATVKEKRKRKRTRAPKNKDEVEKQRMTHIAVERNRRQQMNEHLNSLRSLMPPSYIQRGDQASIVGGAIDFIKELEQLLQSLEAEKRNDGTNETPKTASCSSSSSRACTNSSVSSVSTTSEDGFTARFGGGETAEVEATVIQNHVSLKVRCKRGKGQILKAIVSIEELKLAILHLTISSSFDFVIYSFNLKIEDGCKLGSADEIATTVHQIFEQINGEVMWSNLSRT
ncbi:Myc-type basic helix-loop-helix (bHLH) domain [Arabidopsis thaliana x Arabidopsis arenosa]|uniref:Myc-type basic helix-loop-helix (BHLH) domain n=1 Tax=Arabidopsis thaliana x Arabidopsis arenosa TaxID=1240361 RepID=A0A8T1Z3F6_9BRAS|nr:Myc-type basic helix-loop-helix (bHLH) domain [Arabidopsis thaliana x Arabidopsis arenosa]